MNARSLSVSLALAAITACNRTPPRAPAPPPAPHPAPAVAHAPDTPPPAHIPPADASPAVVATADAATAPPAPSAGRPPADLNILMITVDSLRADMPWAGYARPIAPYLTNLESRAVSYTHAYALSSYTSMSVGGFLGGRLPGELKRDGYFFGTYPSSVLMVQEKLQAAGIRTFSAHAHGYFRRGHAGFDQGFDQWQIIPNLQWNPTTDVEITSDRHAALARRMLSDTANTSGRFFAWFHFLDPHDEYKAHRGIDYGSGPRARYDGEVQFTDQNLASLIDWVNTQPWASRTAIIVSADHGECFGEHHHRRHGFELWQELVHVPWFFVVPGATPRRIDVNRSHLDLAPTVLDLMGVAPEPEFTGHSLVPELRGGPVEARDVLVDLPRTSDNDRRRALITGKHKVIAYSDDAYFQVYDLEADPDETKDLVKTEKELARGLIEKYKAAVKGIRDVKPYACKTLKGTPDNP